MFISFLVVAYACTPVYNVTSGSVSCTAAAGLRKSGVVRRDIGSEFEVVVKGQ